MTKILVTGGFGFIVSNLIDLLVKNKEYSVTVIDNLSSNSRSLEYQNNQSIYIMGDATDIYNLCDDDFNYIIHLAAFGSLQTSFLEPRNYLKNNINSTSSVCEFARDNKAKLIFSSSSTIMHARKKNPYTFSKKVCEDITILDLCSIFPKAKVNYIPASKEEGNKTIALLLENNIKFTCSTKVNLEEYIKNKIIKK